MSCSFIHVPQNDLSQKRGWRLQNTKFDVCSTKLIKLLRMYRIWYNRTVCRSRLSAAARTVSVTAVSQFGCWQSQWHAVKKNSAWMLYVPRYQSLLSFTGCVEAQWEEQNVLIILFFTSQVQCFSYIYNKLRDRRQHSYWQNLMNK